MMPVTHLASLDQLYYMLVLASAYQECLQIICYMIFTGYWQLVSDQNQMKIEQVCF